MPEISNNIGRFLEIQGAGVLAPVGVVSPPGANIFVEVQPDKPNANVTVIETPGIGPEFVMESTAPAFRNPGIQVRVRGNPDKHQEVRAKAEEVRDIIESLANEAVDDGGITANLTNILRATQLGSGINNLGEDKNRRRTYTMNFVLKVTDC